MSPRAGQLSAQQRRSLERDGYLLVPSLLDAMVIAQMASRLSGLVRQTIAAWNADPSPDVAEPEVVHAKLGLADPEFTPCRDHPLLAQAATAGAQAGLASGRAEPARPPARLRPPRAAPDFEHRRTQGPWQTLSAMWCITAFTPDNGPLRVIPGSHRVSQPPIDICWRSGRAWARTPTK